MQNTTLYTSTVGHVFMQVVSWDPHPHLYKVGKLSVTISISPVREISLSESNSVIKLISSRELGLHDVLAKDERGWLSRCPPGAGNPAATSHPAPDGQRQSRPNRSIRGMACSGEQPRLGGTTWKANQRLVASSAPCSWEPSNPVFK